MPLQATIVTKTIFDAYYDAYEAIDALKLKVEELDFQINKFKNERFFEKVNVVAIQQCDRMQEELRAMKADMSDKESELDDLSSDIIKFFGDNYDVKAVFREKSSSRKGFNIRVESGSSDIIISID